MRILFQIVASCLLLSHSQAAETPRTHWSFLPLHPGPPPPVQTQEWQQTPVDSFILSRLEQKSLRPSAQAGARKLVRRIYFDLIGLPPTPNQAETFLQAFAQNPRPAVQGLIDELLASPHYGERWARHWLDVARYADSNGSESDEDRPTAYHYRDFLIRGFNDDLGFDTLLKWQLAGDELEPDNPSAVAATGFIVAGTHIILDVPMEEEKIRTRYNELDDMISTTGSAMLGLTLACARCHDHKYDPIPTRDYYQMLSAFNAGGHTEVPLAPWKEAKAYREAEGKWKIESDTAKKRLAEFLGNVRKEHETTAYQARIDKLKISEEEKAFLKNEPKSDRARELSKKYSKELKVQDQDYRTLVSDEQREEWDRFSATLKRADEGRPKTLPTTLAFADYTAEPRDNWLLGRGDFRSKKEPIRLGFLSAITYGKTASDYYNTARAGSLRDDSTQQRRALAEWMTDLDHGAGSLAARVIVNRVWQHHFGEGLVRTVNDFGVRGQPPTHPELLEWLASEFVKSGWKLKALHRLIMTSAVYLQDSAFDSGKSKTDPENRLLWRQTPRRIESEILRDSMLAVSGMLNKEMFGPAFKPPIPAEAIQARNVKDPYPKDTKETPATQRRTVYMFHKRVVQYPLMQAFDGPDAQASCGRREQTTVAPQALALLNDRFVRARAEDFARRVMTQAGNDNSAQVRLTWRLALGREPTHSEMQSSVSFLDQQKTISSNPSELSLSNFCQAIFALNEFVYVD